MEEFRFSPRPNRAHEIAWRVWGKQSFADAKREKKLVLLAISGVWCHWCHVMDETSYSDPEVISYINAHYIPIRVDTDRRPDVNERYNLGGWPTTAILTHQGHLVTGGTYLPPKHLLSLLRKTNELYQSDPDGFIARVDEHFRTHHRVDDATEEPAQAFQGYKDVFERVVESLKEAYDPVYGGFGSEPKFPMPEVLGFLLTAFGRTGDQVLMDILVHTLKAMAGGGMYDPVEGGFFRYSTTRDWSIPHFEKMLEDNTQLLEVLVRTYAATGVGEFEQTARDVIRYLDSTLYMPRLAAWAGTQDADEEYYSLSLEERRKRSRPYMDETIYVDWNALTARALIASSWILDDMNLHQKATRALSKLIEKCFDPDRGIAHYCLSTGDASEDAVDDAIGGADGDAARDAVHCAVGGGTTGGAAGRSVLPSLFGRLSDQVAVGEACLAAYQSTGEDRWKDFSVKLADYCLTHLQAPNGRFLSAPRDPDAPPAAAEPAEDFEASARACRWLLTLAQVTGDERYRRAAISGLSALSSRWRVHDLAASVYAEACSMVLSPWTVITLAGPADSQTTVALSRVAFREQIPQKLVLTLDPMASPDLAKAHGFEPEDVMARPVASVCIGAKCLRPAHDPETLKEALEEARREVVKAWKSGSPMPERLWLPQQAQPEATPPYAPQRGQSR